MSRAASEAVTEENTSDDEARALRGRDFAVLEPINSRAKSAFLAVQDLLNQDPSWHPEARRHIHYDHDKRTGWFRLNLNALQYSPRRCWLAGARGPHNSRPIELLLCDSTSEYEVSTHHFDIKHNQDTGALTLTAISRSKPVIIDGKYSILGQERVLDAITGIGVGDLQYRFSFTPYGLSDEYAQELRNSAAFSTRELASFSPSPAETRWRNWSIEPAEYGGVSSVVSIATDVNTGARAAVKRIKRSSANMARAIRQEIDLLGRLKHPNICKLVQIRGNKDREDFGLGEMDEIELFLEPAVSATLDRSQLSTHFLPPLWEDCLAGLVYLHDRGIMHNDIKTQNIGIVYGSNRRAVLLDFGAALTATRSTNHRLGTVRCLAPEVIALKHAKSGNTPPPYGPLADVWSLGLAFMEKIHGPVPWPYVEEKPYREFLSQSAPSDPAPAFVVTEARSAMTWSAEDRPTSTFLRERARAFDEAGGMAGKRKFDTIGPNARDERAIRE